MLIINEGQVRDILKEDLCREIMEETLKLVSEGAIKQTLRTALHLGDNNVFGIMPCSIEPKKVFGAKLISVFPNNMEKQLPSHQGSIMLFNGENGIIDAIVDAEAITAVRTSAVSAVATKHLARENSKILTILGAGLQGRQHAKALMKVRDFEAIHIWDSSYDFSKKVADKLSSEIGVRVRAFESSEDAVKDADVICTVTIHRQPIIKRDWLKAGVHINAVGACTPDAREIDSMTMKDASLFVDFKESTVNESGDYLIPLKEGHYDEDHILAELGHVISGKHEGRKTQEEITLFESLGLASEDIAAAHEVYKKVKIRGGIESEII